MSKKIKKQNISINTGEPIEEKELDLNPLAPLAVDGAEDDEDDDDGLKIDEEELDPFGDKWEQ
jgi:RNA polymerase-binding transcription factor DksA